MNELNHDPFITYDNLVAQRDELLALRPNAVDETVGQSIDIGVAALDGRLDELRQDPDFAENVLEHLERAVTAVDQLRRLTDVLPADALDATVAPYRQTARRCLDVAGTLPLDPEKAERFTGLMGRLGDLSVGAAVEVEEAQALPPVASPLVRETTPPGADHSREPVAKPQPDPAASTQESESAPSSVIPPEGLLERHFPISDALVLCTFLRSAHRLLKARQLPAVEPEKLDAIISNLTGADQARADLQRSAEELRQEREAVLARVIELLNNEALLEQVINGLANDDPRTDLLDYLFIGLGEAARQSLINVAGKHFMLIERIDAKQREAAAAAPPESAEALPQGIPEAGGEPVELVAELTPLELFKQEFAALKTRCNQAELDWETRYKIGQLARALQIPLAKIAIAVERAQQCGFHTEAEGSKGKLTPTEFVLAYLHNNPAIAELLHNDKESVHGILKGGDAANGA